MRFQAFDLLELDGVDYRPLPLSRRKDRLARLLARVQVGIAICYRQKPLTAPGANSVYLSVR
jgi:ATP-dependent DNA ligase